MAARFHLTRPDVRLLPGRPDPGQLRRHAKQLYRAATSGDPDACARFAAISMDVTLSGAQLVLAREAGFSSWAQLLVELDQPSAVRRKGFEPPRDAPYTKVPVEALLARNGRGFVAFTTIWVYRTGCMVDLEWLLYRNHESDQAWRSRCEDVLLSPFQSLEPAADRTVDALPRFRIEYADGRSTGNHEPENEPENADQTDSPADAPAGWRRGHCSGGADGKAWIGRGRLYLSPLPPPGELRFDFAWPAFGMGERSTVVHADKLHLGGPVYTEHRIRWPAPWRTPPG